MIPARRTGEHLRPRLREETSTCLNQSSLMFSSLAAGLAASLSLGTWRNRDDGLPSWRAHWVGGSCPNIACMPSKNEISSAKVAQLARDGRHYGTVTGSVTVDMAIVRQRKREMVERQIAKHLQIYRASGAELIMGSGRFVAPKTLEVKLNDGGDPMQARRGYRIGANPTTQGVGERDDGPHSNKPTRRNAW